MKKTTLLFDITGVLLWENKLNLFHKIGLLDVIRYLITHRKNPAHVCFDILARKSDNDAPSDITPITYKDKRLPICISEWQQGKKTNKEVHIELQDYIEKLDAEGYFISPLEKKISEQILHVLMNAEYLAKIARPNKKLIKLIEQIKKEGRHQLYIVSNMAHETFEIIAETYPDMLDLFEDVIISAEIGLVKPDTAIYEHVLNTYNLNPAQCIFIDDQEDNITSARQLGITSLIYRSFREIKQQFKQFDII